MIKKFTDNKKEHITGLKYCLILGPNNYLWIPAFEFAVSGLPVNIKGFNVIEIGAGRGGLSLYFAKRGCNVLCSDINSNLVVAAEKSHQPYKFPGEISYETLDILHNNLADETFDIVCFKSMLGAIPADKQTNIVSEMQRILKKGGHLVFCENLKGSFLSGFYRRCFIPWYKTWNYMTVEKGQRYMESFNDCSISSFWFSAPFLARISHRMSRIGIALDQTLFKRLKNEYRYIMASYAVK